MTRPASLVTIALVVFVAVAGVIGYQYFAWATNASGAAIPYDEVGIALHGMMPGFVQDWGCARLEAEFGGKTLPPMGCESATDPGQWR